MIKRKNIKDIILKGALLCIITLCFSCYERSLEKEIPVPGGEEEVQVVFTLKVPSLQSSARALTGGREEELSTLDLLLFHTGSNGAYIESIAATKIDGTPNLYTATLPKGTYDLMVLANCRQEVNTIAGTPSRQDLIKGLTLELDGEWKVDPDSSAYRPIPMWGMKDNVQVIDNMRLSYDLIRMLAKVNVEVKPGAQERFKLTSIRYYNGEKKG
ncbi:MAG: FimB/Mfa2 family fimbrial subunit [Bacteroides sp.]|nr:FimB/Mfa2 family fimbrial subunit [Bacteroides sp.]